MSVLFFDITKFKRQQRHRSGLNRVSSCLQRELAHLPDIDLRPVYWSSWRGGYREITGGHPVGRGRTGEAFFSPEVFALRERPLSRRWLRRFRGRKATLFYDAIPFLRPETTWPHSVRRFPRWFRDLGGYDKVLFISKEARAESELVSKQTGWNQVSGPILPLGADYTPLPMERMVGLEEDPVLLNVGIIEPRKGQVTLLEACGRLWEEGARFRLVFLGRVNPHFGEGIVQRIEELRARGWPVIHEPEAGDDRLAYWHQRARMAILPSRSEGYGLPAIEALWAGCPVMATPQPSLQALPALGGVQLLKTASLEEMRREIGKYLLEPARLDRMEMEIQPESLPLWSQSARHLLKELELVSSD